MIMVVILMRLMINVKYQRDMTTMTTTMIVVKMNKRMTFHAAESCHEWVVVRMLLVGFEVAPLQMLLGRIVACGMYCNSCPKSH